MIETSFLGYIKRNESLIEKNAISTLSKSDGSCAPPLVNDPRELIDGDKFIKDYLNKKKYTPIKSIDAIATPTKKNNKVYAIEFKTGFKDRIDLNHHDTQCNKLSGEDCPFFKEKFARMRRKIKEQLVENIAEKAKDFFVFLTTLFPPQKADKLNVRLIFCVVIDQTPSGAAVGVFGDLANQDVDVKKALGDRLLVRNGGPYFYDEVNVWNASEFVTQCAGFH